MSSTFTVSVVDLACQAAEQVQIQPSVALATQSQTKIATVLGFPEFFPPSTPPKKYHTFTPTGTSTIQANVFVYDPSSPLKWGIPYTTFDEDPPTLRFDLPGTLGANCGGAQYMFSGVANVDKNGNRTSYYDEQLFLQCTTGEVPPFAPPFQPLSEFPGANAIIGSFDGFCWPADPASCAACDPNSLAFSQDLGEQRKVFTFFNPLSTPVQTSTSISDSSTTQAAILLQPPATANFPVLPRFPGGTGPGQPFPFEVDPAAWMIVTMTQDYAFTLSDEYTDAEALANAQVINGNGSTAQNQPRTTGFVSQFTTVVFELNCTNLIPGQNYVASVILFNAVTGLITNHYPFTATGTTQLISDAIPTPPAGTTTTVQKPSIAFA